jgi:hypothetical protein
MERESRQKAAEHLYNQAVVLLDRAEMGDKIAARKACDLLYDLQKRYYSNYRDKNDLIEKARDLGTSYVVFEVKNHSGKILPADFEDRLLAFGTQDLNTEWRVFSFEEKPGLQYDYKAVFKVRTIDISPERIQERAYTEEKKIQDGWDYVLDRRGNVMKDSAGNDIKTPRMVRIRADILEIHQTKAARISGAVEIRDIRSNELIESRELATEVLFENYAATFRGDERALTQESRLRIGNQPLPFPPDAAMLVQAAERLKPGVKEELRRSRAIL